MRNELSFNMGDLMRADCTQVTINGIEFIRKNPAWKLPDPPAGRQWHRTDWTEDMLPEGWRPLLIGESHQPGDALDFEEHSHASWTTISRGDEAHALESDFFYRTRRPLPPAPRPWSKPEDVPGPVCWIRKPGEIERLITSIHSDGVICDGGDKLWCHLAFCEYSTDRKTWLPCTVTEYHGN